MAINHLNTLAKFHTNHMFKVVLSRELRVYHEVEHKQALTV